MAKKIDIGSEVKEFPAGTFNELVDKLNADRASGLPQQVKSTLANRSYLPAHLHNTTADDLLFGHVLGYDEPAVTVANDPNQFYAGITLKGITTTAAHAGRFAVAVDNIRGTTNVTGGGIGVAAFQGLIPVRVNWTDAAHTAVAAIEGETLLQSGTSGITPIWHEDATGEIWAIILLGGGGGGGGGQGGGVLIALIEEDIPAIVEDDPETQLTAADIVLTEEEIDAGYVVQCQYPTPDDPEDLDSNPVDGLNLWAYERSEPDLKYFHTPTKTVRHTGIADGGASNSITLADGASILSGAYVDSWVTITSGTGSGQERLITAYDGGTLVATVTPGWSVIPIADDSNYEVATREPGYDPTKTKLNLATEIIDDPLSDPPRKIVRYATKQIIFDEGETAPGSGVLFEVGSYRKKDYPDYTGEEWPPLGGDSLPIDEDKFKKRYRAFCSLDAAGHWVTSAIFCVALPPPSLESLGYVAP